MVGYLIFSHRILKQSIEKRETQCGEWRIKYETEQRELRGLVHGLIQSIGDIKVSMEAIRGDIKVLKERQQYQTDNKQTAPDGGT